MANTYLKKIFIIAYYKRNENQNYNDIYITSHQSEWPGSKKPKQNLQTINAGEDVEKREPSCTVGGNVN